MKKRYISPRVDIIEIEVPQIIAASSTESMLLNDLNTSGFMFEAMSESDLRIHAHADGGEPYHYRDG